MRSTRDFSNIAVIRVCNEQEVVQAARSWLCALSADHQVEMTIVFGVVQYLGEAEADTQEVMEGILSHDSKVPT